MTYGYCGILPGLKKRMDKENDIHDQSVLIGQFYPDAQIVEEKFFPVELVGSCPGSFSVLQDLMEQIGSGDRLVLTRVCYLGWSLEQCYTNYIYLSSAGVELVFIKEPFLNSGVFLSCQRALGNVHVEGMGDVLYLYTLEIIKSHIRDALSDSSVAERSARIRAGIELARGAGKPVGQRLGVKLHVKKSDVSKPFILKRSESFGGDLSDAELLARLSISRNTLYKYKRELRAELGKGDLEKNG